MGNTSPTCVDRSGNGHSTVYVVNPDRHQWEGLRALIDRLGFRFRAFETTEAFLAAYESGGKDCLVVEVGRPGRSVRELMRRLREGGAYLPAVLIAERADVASAVRSMRAGASAFIERPYVQGRLLREIRRLLT